MKIYYVNIRGVKSKMESLREIIDIKQSDIVGIVDKHLQEDEDVIMEGYHTIRKDRNFEGGGLLLLIRKGYQWIEEDIEQQGTKNLEGLCVLIGSKTKIRVSLFSALQGEKVEK